ncbi:MAG: DUF1146 domain-containing protein [Firmicutes bacterium]|nr:DUF1146 domain-containing protein [Bacillota bacterium]
MTIKTLLYLIILPFSILALDSINIKNVFKKNKYYQARILYFFLAMALTYLVVNFFYDFFMSYSVF